MRCPILPSDLAFRAFPLSCQPACGSTFKVGRDLRNRHRSFSMRGAAGNTGNASLDGFGPDIKGVKKNLPKTLPCVVGNLDETLQLGRPRGGLPVCAAADMNMLRGIPRLHFLRHLAFILSVTPPSPPNPTAWGIFCTRLQRSTWPIPPLLSSHVPFPGPSQTPVPDSERPDRRCEIPVSIWD